MASPEARHPRWWWPAVGQVLGALLLFITSAGLAACGTTLPSPPVIAQPPKPIKAPKPVLKELPPETLAVGRWRAPSALLSRLTQWANGRRGLELFLRGRVARPAAPIDLDAPIEWLVARDPASETAPSVVRWVLSLAVQGPPPGDVAIAVESPIGWQCRQGRALGEHATRVVCGLEPRDLELLLPAALEVLPLHDLEGPDFQMEIRTGPLLAESEADQRQRARDLIAEQLGLLTVNEGIEDSLELLAESAVMEVRRLLVELDGASLSLVDRVSEQSLAVQLRLPERPVRATSRDALFGADVSGLAPTDFWSLPDVSAEAGFIWPLELSHLSVARNTIALTLGRILDFRGIPKRLELSARSLAEILPLPRGPLVWARGGVGLPGGEWVLLSFGGGLGELDYYLGLLQKAVRDPILWPQFRRLLRPLVGQEMVPVRLERVPLRRRGGLPRGSFQVEVGLLGTPPSEAPNDEPESGEPGPPPPQLVALVVPLGDDAFSLIIGQDIDLLRGLSTTVRPASRTLSARPGLKPLLRSRASLGGYTSWEMLEQSAVVDELREALRLPGASVPVPSTPHRGTTPQPFFWGPDAHGLSGTWLLPRPALDDLYQMLGWE